MAELTPKHSRRGMELASKVAALALVAPDAVGRKTVRDAVDKLRKLYGVSDSTKRKWILKAIVDGCHTYDDIVDETMLHKSQVVELVKVMEKAGEVDLTPLIRGEKGGRPAVYISLSARLRRKITEK